jgi:hypothetical protein
MDQSNLPVKEELVENPQQTTPEPEPEVVAEEPELQSEPEIPKEEPEYGLTSDGEIIHNDGEKKPPVQEKQKDYTPEEIRDIGLDNLDPKRIPTELLPFYKSMQADYTRKTQALKEKEKSLASQPQQPVEQSEPPQPQMTEQQSRDLFYQAAKERAAEMLGVKADEFDEYDARHMAYLTMASQELYGVATQQLEKQRTIERKKQQYSELLSKVQREEPYYDEINQWSLVYLESLPYKEYSEYMRTFHTGTIEEIEGAIQKIRKAWHREKQGARPKESPPVVETGSNDVEEPQRRVTTNTFSRMTAEEKADFLRLNGYAD